jgi:hypothetical protein
MKKSDLVEKIKRRLGYPVVKVELDNAQIVDCIDFSRQKYLKWSAGQGTVEHFYTQLLSAGQTLYDCPGNVTEVLNYEIATTGSVQTLFTIENYLYNQGMYDMILMRGAGSGYTLISYHIARDFLDTVRRYVVDAYNFTYHRYTNQIEIQPPPPSGGVVYTSTASYQSPGWILVRAMVVEGLDEDIYEHDWVFEYALAQSKVILGRIRSKFANFTSIGQTGLTMDGDALISEGQAEVEKLEERLRMEEPWLGYGIEVG